MTNIDVLARVDEVNDLRSQQDRLEAKKSLIQKEIKTLAADQNHKLHCISRREEPREVECDVVFDYEARTVETTFEGEVMSSRKMSEWEFSSRPVDIYPETHKTKIEGNEPTDGEGMTLAEAVEKAGEIAEKEAAMIAPSANVNAHSEAKNETAVEGLNV